MFLVREGILDENEIEALEAEVDREIIEATDRALAAELPPPDSIYEWFIRPMWIPPLATSNPAPKLQASRKRWSK